MHPNIDEYRVREKLAKYLSGRSSLREFTKWFVPNTWNVKQWGTPSLQKLVYGISLRLAEYTSGHCLNEELHERLIPFVTSFEIGEPVHEPQTQSTSKIIIVLSLQPVTPRPFRSSSYGEFVEASL
jgi:hypothetical protein